MMTVASQPPRILTIAGSDTSAGAGSPADIKTIAACGGFALPVLTAITAQDPAGVQAVWPVTQVQLQQQLDCALRFQPQAVKIGMLASAELVDVVANVLATLPGIPVVLDTVIRASSGSALLDEAGVQQLRERLLPHATIITPNLQEAAQLFPGEDEHDWLVRVRDTGVAMLVTGGDALPAVEPLPRYCTDVLVMADSIEHLTLPRVETENHHGTGCTLTAALATFLAHGFPLAEAVNLARQFVHQALLGARQQSWQGHGPLNHFFAFGRQHAVETP